MGTVWKTNKNPSLADLIGVFYVTVMMKLNGEEPKKVFLKEKLTLRLKS
jgi:hypothetical protein